MIFLKLFYLCDYIIASVIVDPVHFLFCYFQLLVSLQFCHSVQEKNAFDFGTQLSQKADCCVHGASRRQDIIDYDHFVTFFDQLSLNFNCVLSILKFVVVLLHFAGQFSLLPHRVHSLVHSEGKGRSKEEAFGLEHEHFVELDSLESFLECVDDESIYLGVRDDGEDIDEGTIFLEIIVGFSSSLYFVYGLLFHARKDMLILCEIFFYKAT